MSFVEQLTAITLLVDFLFGVTFGVMGGAIRGSRRGALLAPGIGRSRQRGCSGHLRGLHPR